MGNVRFHGFLPKNGKYSYKWQPWVDHDIFYDMVKFAFRCFYMGKCLSIRVHATCKLYMVHYSYEKWVYEQFLSRGKSQLSPFNHYLSYFDIYKLSDSFKCWVELLRWRAIEGLMALLSALTRERSPFTAVDRESFSVADWPQFTISSLSPSAPYWSLSNHWTKTSLKSIFMWMVRSLDQ